jgi:hypothetical protein
MQYRLRLARSRIDLGSHLRLGCVWALHTGSRCEFPTAYSLSNLTHPQQVDKEEETYAHQELIESVFQKDATPLFFN